MEFDILTGVTTCARVNRETGTVVNIELVTIMWLAANEGGDDDWYFVRCDADDPAWIGLKFLGPDDGFEQPPSQSTPDDYENDPDVLAFRGE